MEFKHIIFDRADEPSRYIFQEDTNPSEQWNKKILIDLLQFKETKSITM